MTGPLRTVELPTVPPLGDSYRHALTAAAAGAVSRRVGRAGRGGATTTLPDVTLSAHGVQADAERLTAYQHLVGEPGTDVLPAGFVHVLAFPVATALMVRDDFPLPLLGLVHVANRVEQRRPLRLGQELDVRSWATGLRAHRSGTQVDLVSEVAADGVTAWRGVSTYLAKGVRLAPAGEISGTVRVVNADGTLSPMPDALVEYQNLDTPNEQSGLTRSGADGRYVIRGLNGRYQLEFEGPDESARILPEFLGGSRTADGAQIVEIRNNAVVGGKDVVLEVGGILEGWAKYVPTPGIGGSGYLNSFFTTFAFSRLDTSTGKYVRVDAPGPGEPINGDPYWGPLEPGTYRIVVDNVYWDGDPGAPGAKRYTFHGGVTGIVVGRDAVTDFGDLPLTTRYFDVSRASGADRFATSAAVSAATFAPGVPVAYLANGMTFPDALSGAAAAGAKNGPVLLTAASSIPAEISAELARLAPQRIVVLGGAGAVSDAVVAKAKTLTHGSVSRLSGADRYSTSAAISRATFATGVPVAYLANGMTFPDALSGAAAAAKLGGPVLLTATGALSAPVKAELSRLAPKKIVVLGGTGAVAEAVLRQARVYTHGTVTRASGADRYATSAALSAVTFASGVPVVYLADGLTFPDALSGAAAAGSRGGPVLLVEPGGIPEATADELIRLAPKKIVALGGTGALTDAVLDDARSVLSYVSAQTP
ncbi:MAG: cell wall-binding repeat-containing protein [Microbacterium sp.]|nr:cell wall-binding repeat-containing protein [Microbacterium sp.]